jgi:aspartyl/asparaginyl beta-hydroxylase (cupin superfamily)
MRTSTQNSQLQNYTANEPYFWHDIIKDSPICIDLVNNYEQIKKEALDFIKDPATLFDYPKYTVHYNNAYYDLYDNYWKAVPLSVFEKEYIDQKSTPEQLKQIDSIIANSKQRCPTIDKVIAPLEKQGYLVNAFISRLIPGSIINPHDGTSPHFMRTHMGLVCDSGCRITVGEETRTWEEGKLLAFKDGGPYLHSVKHEGTSERIILSVDIRMDPYLKPYMNNYTLT